MAHDKNTPGPPATTWALLLAQWMEFARASVALPRDAEGDRWRATTPAVITLQAVTMALGEVDILPDARERAAGASKAGLLIRRTIRTLHELWKDQPLHPELVRLIDDATAALARIHNSGLEWRIRVNSARFDHPADLVVELAELGFAGDLYLPTPGVPMFAGAPAAFARDGPGGEPTKEIAAAIGRFLGIKSSKGAGAGGTGGRAAGGEVSQPVRVTEMQQVYRQLDFSLGRPVRDVVVPISETPPAGQPLLVPVILAGELQPVTLPPRNTIHIEPVPVVARTDAHTGA